MARKYIPKKYQFKKPPTIPDTRTLEQKQLEYDRVHCVEALSVIIDRASADQLPKSVGIRAMSLRTKVRDALQPEQQLAKDVKKAQTFIGKYGE
jgi:hypothetical protein